MYTLTYNGELFVCPAIKDKPAPRVLDCGTGTGIWAMDYGMQVLNIASSPPTANRGPADENPEATVNDFN